jgi:hypothetical protein
VLFPEAIPPVKPIMNILSLFSLIFYLALE